MEKIDTQPEPISAEELAKRLVTISNMTVLGGLRRCPHSSGFVFCGCAPDQCAAMRKPK